MKVFYRISDNGYRKQKLPGASKKACLENFLEKFGKIDVVIADNCHDETLSWLYDAELNVVRTSLGNAPSFIYAMDMSMSEQDGETIYFVEDDYLHNEGSRVAIEDGLAFGDYATLYDHPDKYGKSYGGGEECTVFRKGNRHWRTSVSTTMTFACKVGTIREDQHVFRKHCSTMHPNDHEIFLELSKSKNRRLCVSIPGMSFHADITTQIFSEEIRGEIDGWALSYLESVLKSRIYETNDGDSVEKMEDIERAGSSGLAKIAQLEDVLSKRD